jgi:hypothetical protein
MKTLSVLKVYLRAGGSSLKRFAAYFTLLIFFDPAFAQNCMTNEIGQTCIYERVRTLTGHKMQWVCGWNKGSCSNQGNSARPCEVYCSATDSACVAKRQRMCGY